MSGTKKTFKLFLTFLISVILLYALRTPIFRATGNFLIYEDSLEKSDVIFVLGGGSFDRGNEAAKLYKEGYASNLVCTGGNVPNIFKAIDIGYKESEVTKIHLVKNKNVPDNDVILLPEGTSTKEESRLIINYCINNKIDKAIVLSSKFHTRRINYTFRNSFEENGIRLILHGAPSDVYSENEWWKSEEGLIMVNNEYIKLLYYFVKY